MAGKAGVPQSAIEHKRGSVGDTVARKLHSTVVQIQARFRGRKVRREYAEAIKRIASFRQHLCSDDNDGCRDWRRPKCYVKSRNTNMLCEHVARHLEENGLALGGAGIHLTSVPGFRRSSSVPLGARYHSAGSAVSFVRDLRADQYRCWRRPVRQWTKHHLHDIPAEGLCLERHAPGTTSLSRCATYATSHIDIHTAAAHRHPAQTVPKSERPSRPSLTLSREDAVQAVLQASARGDLCSLRALAKRPDWNALVCNSGLGTSRGGEVAAPRGMKYPLHVAIEYGHHDVVDLLLGSVVDLNLDLPDREGRSSLGLASFFGRVSIVQRLLQRGASLKQEDRGGRNVLHLACCCDSPEVVRVLLQHEPGLVNSMDVSGRTGLFYALVSPHEQHVIDIVGILLQNEADVNHVDNTGNQVLSYAHNAGVSSETMDLLLRAREKNERRWLETVSAHWRAGQGSTAAENLLLERNIARKIATSSWNADEPQLRVSGTHCSPDNNLDASSDVTSLKKDLVENQALRQCLAAELAAVRQGIEDRDQRVGELEAQLACMNSIDVRP